MRKKDILWPGYRMVFSRSFEGFRSDRDVEAWNRDDGYEILVDDKVVHSLSELELLKFHADERFDAIVLDAVRGALKAIKFCVSSPEEGEAAAAKEPRVEVCRSDDRRGAFVSAQEPGGQETGPQPLTPAEKNRDRVRLETGEG